MITARLSRVFLILRNRGKRDAFPCPWTLVAVPVSPSTEMPTSFFPFFNVPRKTANHILLCKLGLGEQCRGNNIESVNRRVDVVFYHAKFHERTIAKALSIDIQYCCKCLLLQSTTFSFPIVWLIAGG